MQAVNTFGHMAMLNYRAECDIRMDFDTNEYPNIFVSRIRIYSYEIFETNESTNIFVSKF